MGKLSGYGDLSRRDVGEFELFSELRRVNHGSAGFIENTCTSRELEAGAGTSMEDCGAQEIHLFHSSEGNSGRCTWGLLQASLFTNDDVFVGL